MIVQYLYLNIQNIGICIIRNTQCYQKPTKKKSCQTNGKAQKNLNDSWFENPLFDITIYWCLHLQQILEKSKKEENGKIIMGIQSINKSINFSENKIPQSLRLGQIFFTQLVIVGDFVQHQNEIVSYFDEDDIISCIITLGEPWYSGETMYYNGVTQINSSNIEIKIPFQHCRLQTDSFNKILHGVKQWVEPRLTLNFNFKKNCWSFQTLW